MKAFAKATGIILSVVIVLASFSLVAAQSVSIDHVDGLNAEGLIEQGAALTFYIHITGDSTFHRAIANGFRVYSGDITWDPIDAKNDCVLNPAYPWDWSTTRDSAQPPKLFFDLGKPGMDCLVRSTGSGADTVGWVACVGSIGTGLPPGFDDIAYSFKINNVKGPAGAELTVDSSYFPPAGFWLWEIVEKNVAWEGPYTYKIK